MRKRIIYPLLCSTLLLASCFNRRTDTLFECSFNVEEENITYYLEVKNISYDDFVAREKKNVVEDDVEKEKYYLINFYSKTSNDVETKYDFYNLRPLSKAKKNPISYVDDNNHLLTPCSVFRGKDGKLSYLVNYENIYLTFGSPLVEEINLES